VKVLYIVTAYDRQPDDGITPWLVETLQRLQRRGIEPEVLAPSYQGLGSERVAGIMVHRFRYAPRRLEDLTHDQTAPDRIRQRPHYLALVPGYLAASAVAARRLAAGGDFDVVHVHWPLPHVVPGWAAASTGIPLVLTFHGVELTFAHNTRLPLLVPLLRRAVRTADAVTANSRYTAGLVRELHDRPVEIVPFGSTIETGSAEDVEAVRFRSAPPMPAPEGGAGDPGPFRLLFVGRLVERKGVHYLLDALARLPSELPVHLDVVGAGPMREALEARSRAAGVSDRVVFHGFVAGDELRRRYAGADAFVLPAAVDTKGDVEGLGVVLIEAASFGLPLIASEAGGITDIVIDDETGVLVPPGDPDRLANAIRALSSDPVRARRLGRRAREHANRSFSWDRIIDTLERLYHDLAGTDGTD
jgi:glycosyltransferase involved in cell wall biosynthesis